MPFVRIRESFSDLVQDERGTTAIEYGLIASLVILALLVGLQAFGTSVSEMYDMISTAVTSNT